MKSLKRFLTVIVLMAVVFTFMPVIDGQAYAASKKKPEAPKNLSAKEVTTVADDYKIVVVKWSKAKGAKKYEAAIRSTDKKWVKIKTVKKNAKNRKKYTKPNKYKVVAKGKKYKVYQYQYKYSKMGTTGKCSFRFMEAPGWEDLKGDTTYIFAIRSVNGKKYSAWKTVSLKTSLPAWDNKKLTSPGESLKMTVNGQTYTPTVGKQCTLPVPAPKKGTIEAKSFTIVPGEIEYTLQRDNSGNQEDFTLRGKTPDGYNAWYRITIDSGVCESVGYSYGSGSGYEVEGLGYGPGYMGKRYTVTESGVTVAWTADGTEPDPGQADKSVKGNEYPFDQVTSNGTPYNGDVKVRGTAVYGSGSTTIWGELKKALFNKCEWIRIYRGNSVVEEHFNYEGYYN